MTASKPWSQYWSQGHKTSFGNTFNDCYEGIIKSEWRKVFMNMKPEDSVLDLCTGNASLIRLAKQESVCFSAISFTGVDYADVVVDQQFLNLANVKLLFNQNIEQLSFRDNTFDFVISNFGIEYSCLTKSLSEAARVLKDGGRIDFFCHHIESKIIQSSQTELLMLTDIYKNNGAIGCLKKLITSLEKKVGSTSADDSEHWRLKLNECLALLVDKFGATFHQGDFITFLKFVLKPTTKEKMNIFKIFNEEMIDYKMRLNEMVNAAITLSKIEDIMLTLTSLGFIDIVQAPILSEGECIAYKIEAIKKSIIN